MELRLSQFGPSVSWLLARDVPATRLAAIFDTTPENIRVIAFRARHGTSVGETVEIPLSTAPVNGLAESVGVRGGPDEVVPTKRRARKLEEIRVQIDDTVLVYSSRYRFLDGARALRQMLPKIGFAGDVRRVALAGLVHQQIAWFLVHGGQSESAAHEASLARTLWRLSFHESRRREYAEGFVQSALIGSNALLLGRRPEGSWKILELAQEAARSNSIPIGSEPMRQRGVALFMLKEDERAAQHFRMAADAMDRLGEAQHPVQILMTGARHVSMAELDFQAATEVFDAAARAFGAESLESAMALHWAVACGLATDSAEANRNALALIENASEPADHFGHQLTIRKLLEITPELGLDLRLRRAWVRRALYENAFRNR